MTSNSTTPNKPTPTGPAPPPARRRSARAPPPPEARRGPVGARLPRAAQRQRAVQEGRRRAQRPGPDREHLRPPRLRLHRPRRPARPVPLVGPLHPAQARASTAARPRSSSRTSSTTSTSCCASAVDGGQLSPAQLRAIGRHLHRVRPRHRRHHRPAEHPVPLDPHRGRARRSGSGSRRSACRPQRPAATRPRVVPRLARSPASPPTRSSTAPRRSTRSSARYIGDPAFSNLPRKFKTAISRPPEPRRGTRDQRHLVRRRRCTPSTAPASTSGSAAACPPTRCSPSGSACGSRWTRSPDVWAGVVADLPRLRLPPAAHPGPAEVPGRRLGRGEVPRGARGRVPRPRAGRRPRPRAPPDQPATTSACTGRRTASSTSAPPRPSAGSPARCSAGSPTSPRQYGSDRVRLTAVPEAGRARRRPDDGRLAASPTLRRRSACRPGRRTGAATRWPAPASSSASSRSSRPRQRAADLVDELERRFPDLDTPITVNVNGCPNACARTQVADIGLKGQLVLDDDGNQVEGFQVHLGGGLGARPAGFGRKLRGLKVTSAGLDDYVERRRARLPGRPRATARRSPTGWPAPTRSCCAARRRWRRCR